MFVLYYLCIPTTNAYVLVHLLYVLFMYVHVLVYVRVRKKNYIPMYIYRLPAAYTGTVKETGFNR